MVRLIKYAGLIGILLVGIPAESPADFESDYEHLFGKMTVDREPWIDASQTVDGWDWSLPSWVRAHPKSMLKLWRTKVKPGFPARVYDSGLRYSWKELEPQEGVFDFEPLRAEIISRSEGGTKPVELHIDASVWETRYFDANGNLDYIDEGSAPRWFTNYPGVNQTVEYKILNFRVVNLAIYHDQYHSRYTNMVAKLAEAGIPQMPEISACYVHFKSATRGEEGDAPTTGTGNYAKYLERLDAWAAAFSGIEYKLCTTTGKGDGLQEALNRGMGSRNGYVEMYMLHTRNSVLGQWAGTDGYLITDESNPHVADDGVSGDENEEYANESHITRFGPVSTWPHRYRESSLRALQMRRSVYWAEGGPFIIDPHLLNFVALELGRKRADESPDAWCYLRESWADGNYQVKNFERWLYQRDGVGTTTTPTEKVDFGAQGAKQQGHNQAKLYDYTARMTSINDGQDAITFAVADDFLSGGPHRVAIKVTYVDKFNAQWELRYQNAQGTQSIPVVCGDTGETKTITFILDDAHFTATGFDTDFDIHALVNNVRVRMVRLVKRDKPANFPNVPGPDFEISMSTTPANPTLTGSSVQVEAFPLAPLGETVSNAVLYVNDVPVRTNSAAPYQWGSDPADTVLQNMAAGIYELRVVATDSSGATAAATNSFWLGAAVDSFTGAIDTLWSEPGNWGLGALPAPTTFTTFYSGVDCLVDIPTAAVSKMDVKEANITLATNSMVAATEDVFIGNQTGAAYTSTVHITAATLDAGTVLYVGRRNDGILNVYSGSQVDVGTNLRMGDTAGVTGELNLFGGTMNVVNEALVGIQDSAPGKLSVFGGTLSVDELRTSIKANSQSSILVDGGTILVDGDSTIGELSSSAVEIRTGELRTGQLTLGANSTIDLTGGGMLQVTGGALPAFSGGSVLNIESNGVLVVAGLQGAAIDALAAAGTITFANGGDQMLIPTWDYTRTNGTSVLYISELPTAAVVWVNRFSPYQNWSDDFLLNGGPLDDDDEDGLSNLHEYGLGGHPKEPMSQGHAQSMAVLDLDGTLWFEYVYPRRKTTSGLIYRLERSDDLTSTNWLPAGEIELPNPGFIDEDFEAVTNRIDTTGTSQEFIRLMIEQE